MGQKKTISSPIKQKILLLIASGVVLALTRSSRTQRYVLSNIPKALRQINRSYLRRIMLEFRDERLIDYKENDDGETIITLSELGQKKVLRFKLDELSIKELTHWDKKWRVVIFDIPEKQKSARESLRNKLKELEFVELQHSVWIHAYPCEDEINFITEVFDLRPYVRLMEVGKITNEASLLLSFDLQK